MQKMLFRICICIACIGVIALAADVVYASVNKDNTTKSKSSEQSFYDFVVKTNDSTDFALRDLQGKVVLVVNTATKCGFTPQYEGLQTLYAKYHEQGFEILDFPCNQFLNQAPGTNAQIREFCQTTYHTTFPQMAKIDVNGDNAHPLYVFLKAAQDNHADIKWNFEKFLIDRQGNVVARFSTKTKPEEIEQQIKEALSSVNTK